MHFTQIVSVLAVLTATIAAPSPRRNHIQVAARSAGVEPRQPFNPYHAANRFAATAENKRRASNHGRDAAPVEKRKFRKRGGKCAAKSVSSSAIASSSASATEYYVPAATVASSSAWVDPSSSASSSSAPASSTLNVQNAAVDNNAWSSSASSTHHRSSAASSTAAAWSSAVVSSSAAPATTSSASTGGDWKTGGKATYYYQNGNPGACGEYKSDSDRIIAINGLPGSFWPDYSVKSPYCGKWVTIVNTANGKTTSAMVADVCPSCTSSPNSIDLSVAAFQDLADLSEGEINIRWAFSN